MMVPDFIGRRRLSDGTQQIFIQNYEEHPITGRRQLIGLSELDVSRDIVDFVFVT